MGGNAEPKVGVREDTEDPRLYLLGAILSPNFRNAEFFSQCVDEKKPA